MANEFYQTNDHMEPLNKFKESLTMLAKEYWGTRLVEEPLMATGLGDRRFDDQLQDITLQGRLKKESRYQSILQRVNSIPENVLSGEDRLTRTALVFDVSTQINFSRCRLEEWMVDPLSGPQVELLNVESYQPVRTPVDGRAMVKRWRNMGKFLDDHILNLRRGAADGKLSVLICVEKVIDEIQDLLAKPEDKWPLLRPLTMVHDDWSEAEIQEFRDGIINATWEFIRPAFARYLEFLKLEILPRSRSQERPGILYVPNGSEAYIMLVRGHTSLDLTPDQLHQIGLDEVAKINEEMETLGNKLFGIRNRVQILERLRTDKSLYFTNRDEVAAKAEAALSRAKLEIPKWFGRLPKADCEVVRMEPHEEKHSTIAYYRQPAADGSRPGRYYINTSEPKSRPRYEAEVLAYHESIPGHHLQIAIAQELENLPEFRKQSGVTAFIEGWGLYSERLADEMGLYSSDLDRIGVLSYDAWRACRLVVDTGMHAKGWTRKQAIEFMIKNSALAENNIMNEVDRYISWPGHALAYKSGQLEMKRLREYAEKRLSGRFDIREFHDILLSNGALPLEALRQTVEEYSGRHK